MELRDARTRIKNQEKENEDLKKALAEASTRNNIQEEESLNLGKEEKSEETEIKF